MAARGARGIIGLSRTFKIMDDNHSMSLDKYEFNKAMTDFAAGFSGSEIDQLFKYFDANGNGLIEYDEFLRTIRGPMSNVRVVLCLQAFAKMDKDGNGVLELSDI